MPNTNIKGTGKHVYKILYARSIIAYFRADSLADAKAEFTKTLPAELRGYAYKVKRCWRMPNPSNAVTKKMAPYKPSNYAKKAAARTVVPGQLKAVKKTKKNPRGRKPSPTTLRTAWFANVGPDHYHWQHKVTVHAKLSDAKKWIESQLRSGWVWVIIKGEDKGYSGTRKFHSAGTTVGPDWFLKEQVMEFLDKVKKGWRKNPAPKKGASTKARKVKAVKNTKKTKKNPGGLKITETDYNILLKGVKRALRDTQHDYKGWLAGYKRNKVGNDPEKRCRWDLVWHASRYGYLPDKFFDRAYKYLDDTHIDSALKRIVTEI